eukprot:1671871-Amphidinium_carterae.1
MDRAIGFHELSPRRLLFGSSLGAFVQIPLADCIWQPPAMRNDGVLLARVLTEDVPSMPRCVVPKQVCTLEEAEELPEDVLRGVPNRFKVSYEEGSMEWEKSATLFLRHDSNRVAFGSRLPP